MKSFTTLKNLFTNLSNNTSPENKTLGGQLINDQYRYLLQKYFDNEKTYTTTTIGGGSYTLTGALISGDTTATMTAVWPYATVKQLVNFSNSNQREVTFTNGSAAISWSLGLTSAATTAITSVGVQSYPIPANISKITDDTISVGQLKFVPAPIQTRQDWDRVNFLPYTSDIPNYYYIYDNTVQFWPIPSTTGNVITFNYKSRVADLTYADVTDGTIAAAGMTVGGYGVTGLTTSWVTTDLFPANVDLSYANLKIAAAPPYGDGIWYPITKFTSNTALVLSSPVINAPNITAATPYTIGQFPLLSEDFHDMLVYGALMTYYTSIKKDMDQVKAYETLYTQRLALLEDYAGTKSINVNLGEDPPMINPNLFVYST